MTILIDLFWTLAFLVYWPVLLYRILWLGKSRHGWKERWGYIPVRQGDAPLIWLHCVSVGEVNLVRALVDALRQELPAYRLAVSATTDTGIARARELFGPYATVFHYPLDFSCAVRRVLNRLRPSLIVLAELEVWPNLALLAVQAHIPLVVVNGRITERSFRRYHLILPAVRLMMSKLAAAAAQDEPIAQRFISLGTPADRVHVLGTMKFDTAQIADELPGTNDLADAVDLPRRNASNRPKVWVAGQTGPGEEEIVLAAYQQLLTLFPTLRLVLVPRKPERFNEVANLVRQRGFPLLRRSEHPNLERGTRNAEGGIKEAEEKAETQSSVLSLQSFSSSDHPIPRSPNPEFGNRQSAIGNWQSSNSELKTQNSKLSPVVLLDTMGELRTVYPLADVVLVGRSLVPLGGSDVMEVAGLAKPILVGPYTENFAEPVRLLREAGGLIQLQEPAIDVQHSLEFPNWAGVLYEAVRNLLINPEAASALGAKARQVLIANKGSTQAHLKLIREVLGKK